MFAYEGYALPREQFWNFVCCLVRDPKEQTWGQVTGVGIQLPLASCRLRALKCLRSLLKQDLLYSLRGCCPACWGGYQFLAGKSFWSLLLSLSNERKPMGLRTVLSLAKWAIFLQDHIKQSVRGMWEMLCVSGCSVPSEGYSCDCRSWTCYSQLWNR